MLPWTCAFCGGVGGCTGCSRCGGYDALLHGVGIQDGRGYGPYNRGYYRVGGDNYLPIGPHGERLSAEYDFQPGPNGDYLPPNPPLRTLAGALGADEAPSVSSGLVVLLLLVGAGGIIIGLSGAGAFEPRRKR